MGELGAAVADVAAPPALELPAGAVAIVGAGPAGLAIAGALRAHATGTVLLERGAVPGPRWSERYDILELNTLRRYSGLPGYPIPAWAGRYPSARLYARYLRDYAAHHGLDIRTGRPAEAITRLSDGRWEIATPQGPVRAHTVVVATGHDAVPVIPDWPGRDGFPGPIVHAADYRNAAPFAGQDVLVVGAGNSGADIALDLAGTAAEVRVAVRTPPHIVPRVVFGVPWQRLGIALSHLPPVVGDTAARLARRLVLGDLGRHGLPTPATAVSESHGRAGIVPTVDRGGFAQLVRQGRIRIVAAVARIEDDTVVLADGTRIAPDAIVAATGYRTGLEPLLGHLGVLDARGLPRTHAPDSPAGADGLYLAGYRDPLTGNLRDIAAQATALAARIAAAPRSSTPSERP